MRSYNFSAGPSTLPLAVLEKVKDSCLEWQDGMGIMEVSHRDHSFIEMTEAIEERLRRLMSIPKNYKILFCHGGASMQFAMVPINLLGNKTRADYFCTGAWSEKAICEAERFCNVNIVASSKEEGFISIPERSTWNYSPDSAYCHFTPNETIHGIEFNFVPDTQLPLVADMSSNILSRSIDVTEYSLIYAGSQKNLGPAGLALIILDENILSEPLLNCPSMLDYRNHIVNKSMYNTPPTFTWYVIGLVLEWLDEQGGLEAIEKINIRKAQKLYAAIDSSDFYYNNVKKDCRSRMNIPFLLAEPKLEKEFLTKAEKNGLYNLNGHRSVGGMRASIYNAMPEKGVDSLIEFMKHFAATV